MARLATATGTAGAAVTLTLPATASVRHRIVSLEITLYNTAARTGGATPVVVTSTNLVGNPAWTFPSAGAVGTVDRMVSKSDSGIATSTVNTATTIVCPATTGVMWRVNVLFEDEG